MADTIEIYGIETNNLKNIDVRLEKRAVNLVIGPSGSGKSSLAYDTIAQISQHEFMSMFADEISEPTYRVRSYQGMAAAIPIHQSNYNSNMRSTIGTYFGLNRNIALFYAASLGLDESLFVLNKEGNLCEHCRGLGSVKALDENRILDYDIPLEKNPFKCWNRHKDFYAQILQQFCADNGIDSKKNFRQLSAGQKQQLLFAQSEKKYSIRYKKTNAFSRRTTKFYGVMTGIPMLANFSPAKQFFADRECAHCQGKKYAPGHEQYRVHGISIGQFMTMPFGQLYQHVARLLQSSMDTGLSFALESISSFLKKAIELNLGHLFLNRAIPTLSGGELQRLRLVQVFNTQLTDLLIVLDEPLAGLSGAEKESVYQNILSLSARHTLVIVDHSDIFVQNARVVIALGEQSGKKGGFLIDASRYLAAQKACGELPVAPPEKLLHIAIANQVYQYTGVNLLIADGGMNLVTGKSGVGKSTLLREYLPQHFERYAYINQKPLLGNKNSSVATLLDIFGKISSAFAKQHNRDKRFFSNLTGCEGACPTCSGAGYVEFGSGPGPKIHLECRECGGTGFHRNLKKYKLNGKSIFDVWDMTIDEATEYFLVSDKNIAKALQAASAVLLGHLRLGQPTATLSGGENIRIKILRSAKSTARVLGIDEPFKGLSCTEIHCVAKYLNRLREDGKTLIVADHSEAAVPYFAKCIELKNEAGMLVDNNA